jgi:hypothetical protein
VSLFTIHTYIFSMHMYMLIRGSILRRMNELGAWIPFRQRKSEYSDSAVELCGHVCRILSEILQTCASQLLFRPSYLVSFNRVLPRLNSARDSLDLRYVWHEIYQA